MTDAETLKGLLRAAWNRWAAALPYMHEKDPFSLNDAQLGMLLRDALEARPSPSPGEHEALIAEARVRTARFDCDRNRPPMHDIGNWSDAWLARRLADALARSPGSMEGEALKEARAAILRANQLADDFAEGWLEEARECSAREEKALERDAMNRANSYTKISNAMQPALGAALRERKAITPTTPPASGAAVNGVGWRFKGTDAELIAHLLRGERELGHESVHDAALPAYIGEAAVRLQAKPSPPLGVVEAVTEFLAALDATCAHDVAGGWNKAKSDELNDAEARARDKLNAALANQGGKP